MCVGCAGTGEKIKLVGQCKCWALDDDTVSLRDCDEDGTDFLVPEEEGQIRPVGSPGNQCLVRRGSKWGFEALSHGASVAVISMQPTLCGLKALPYFSLESN